MFLNLPPILLTKLDVAERQLREAVRLFFDEADPVAVHTLAAAATEVLYDLARRAGHKSVLRDMSPVKPERRAEWIALLRLAQNFFKHADRDPEGAFQFQPEITRLFLYEAVELLRRFTDPLPHEASVYRTWFPLAYPTFFRDPAITKVVVAARENLDPHDFAFFRAVLAKDAA